uniref:Uncharacterized protein n=1 Tax=Zea mays TaxID=4577 RepID=B6T2P0_MAIZE|nr:hypothetical protein [Zea mays]|eukprot:NP_001143369.1 uncharacterized protein LOC100275999 [Zea mays]
MELFPDGGFVRLQNRANRRYVHADEDWVGVSLRPNGPVPSLNAVWRVEHWVSPLWPNDGDTFVLLQNAAYGRYLSSSMDEAPHGHLGQRATQHNRDDPQVLDIHPPWIWSVERLHPPDNDYVRLRHYAHNLRANGRYKIWNIGVTVDYNLQYPASSTMIQWAVHAVEASPSPQPLPLTLQHQGARRGLFFWRRTRIRGPGIVRQAGRRIRHVRASDEGNFDQNQYNWSSFFFYDSSLVNLRYELGRRQDDWNEDMLAFTLCMRPGSHGRLMPMVTDLPGSLDPMSIVVLRTGSPAAAALVYPDQTVDERRAELLTKLKFISWATKSI